MYWLQPVDCGPTACRDLEDTEGNEAPGPMGRGTPSATPWNPANSTETWGVSVMSRLVRHDHKGARENFVGALQTVQNKVHNKFQRPLDRSHSWPDTCQQAENAASTLHMEVKQTADTIEHCVARKIVRCQVNTLFTTIGMILSKRRLHRLTVRSGRNCR